MTISPPLELFPLPIKQLQDWLTESYGISLFQARQITYILLEQDLILEQKFDAVFSNTLVGLPEPKETALKRLLEFLGAIVSTYKPSRLPSEARPATSDAATLIPIEPGKITPVVTYPPGMGKGEGGGTLRNAIYTLISKAESEIKISSPFLDDPGINIIWQAFEEFAGKSVKLRILVKVSDPISPQKKSIHAYLRIYDLFGNKAEIKNFARYYGPVQHGSLLGNAGSVHSKLVIADGKSAYIGSGEITTSSLTTNFETGAVFTGRELVGFYEKAFDFVWSKSDLITAEWLNTHIFSIKDV